MYENIRRSISKGEYNVLIKNVILIPLKIFELFYNLIISLKKKDDFGKSDLKYLDEIKQLSSKRTQTNDHLVNLFIESIQIKPKLIVELGVMKGESTFVFERVAKLCDSKLISVDIADCSKVTSWKDWIFIKSDDIEFSKKFLNVCEDSKILPKIDILFIDTSHYFEHTVKEIEHWFPFLGDNAKVFFHDTNLNTTFFRKDGSIGIGFDNQRGVIRAIENYLNRSYNEKRDFIDYRNFWLIKHYSYCNGLSIMQKCPLPL